MKQKQSSPALSRLNHFNGWVRQADRVKDKQGKASSQQAGIHTSAIKWISLSVL